MPSPGANTTWFEFSVSGGPEFSVYSFSGVERVSSPYAFEIELVSPYAGESLIELIGREACLTIADRSGVSRPVHGLIEEMEQVHTGNFRTHYRCTLVPRFRFLGARRNHRIFQHKSVIDIISLILREQNFSAEAFSFKCFSIYKPREYCVQYGESDLHFISRLCEEEGIYYYFEHTENSHCLCFSDMAGGPRISGESDIRFFSGSGQPADTAVISRAALHTQSVSDKAVYRDWNFLTPSIIMEGKAEESDFHKAPTVPGLNADYYAYPHIFQDLAEASRYADIQLHRQLSLQTWLEAGADVSRFLPGFTFSIYGHDREEVNEEWWILSVTHSGEQPQVLEHEAPDRGMRYSVQLAAIPGQTRYVPDAVHPKTPVVGEQTALVTGLAGEEIYPDEYGRVKVQFFWDREGGWDEHTTCRIRPAQGWAGTEYGSHAIPRVGHEVMVSFREGDPDRPLITGRLYNADSMPPYELPGHRTRTVFRSMSTPGGEGERGFNEFRVEDKTGEEEIYVHAEKDVNIHVKNDWEKHILHDRHQTVDSNAYAETKGETHISLQGPRKTELFADDHFTLHADSHVKIDKQWLGEAGEEIHVESGRRMILEAGSQLTVKAGGSWLTVNAGGVYTQGGRFDIAGGGTPGNAASAAPLLPVGPMMAKFTDNPDAASQNPQTVEAIASSSGQEGADPVSDKDNKPAVELEVEFLHCASMADYKNVSQKISGIAEDRFIREEQQAYILGIEEKQFVNLPLHDKWRNADITHVDRLGRKPRIVVRFKHKLSRRVRVEIIPIDTDAALCYSEQEKQRSITFRENLAGEYTTNSRGMVIMSDLYINSMGGNKYKVKAVDVESGKEVFSHGTIVCWKYLWIQRYLCADGFWKPVSDPFSSLDSLVTEYKKSYINLDVSLPVKNIKGYEFVDFNDSKSSAAIKKALKADSSVAAKLPYITSAAVCRAIGVQNIRAQTLRVKAGPNCRPISIPVADAFVASYSVYDEAAGVYGQNEWLINASYEKKNISHLVTCGGSDRKSDDRAASEFLATHIWVDVSQLDPGEGDLFITYRIVPDLFAGRFWGGITHCAAEVHRFSVDRNAPKRVKDYLSRAPIVVGHEIGHWIGMVCNGERGFPDGHADFYDQYSAADDLGLSKHIGPHCKSGYNGRSGTCLMFGAADNISFCKNCRAMSRKLNCCM